MQGVYTTFRNCRIMAIKVYANWETLSYMFKKIIKYGIINIGDR